MKEGTRCTDIQAFNLLSWSLCTDRNLPRMMRRIRSRADSSQINHKTISSSGNSKSNGCNSYSTNQSSTSNRSSIHNGNNHASNNNSHLSSNNSSSSRLLLVQPLQRLGRHPLRLLSWGLEQGPSWSSLGQSLVGVGTVTWWDCLGLKHCSRVWKLWYPLHQDHIRYNRSV